MLLVGQSAAADFHLSNSAEMAHHPKLLSSVHSVPYLKCGRRGGGGGVVISDRCDILTNVHVIQACATVSESESNRSAVKLDAIEVNGQKLAFTIVAAGFPDLSTWPNLDTRDDSTKDWAIIKLESSACGRCVPVAGWAQVGEPVWALGYPLPTYGQNHNAASYDDYELANPPRRRPLHFSRGPLLSSPVESSAKEFWKENFAARSNKFFVDRFFFADLSVNAGNSGGPLLSEQAELLGIASVAVFRDILRGGPALTGNGAFLKIEEIKNQLSSALVKETFACSAN